MIIVLEGENKTGKSTIADKLYKSGFTLFKCSQPKTHPYLEYMQLLGKAEKCKNAVIDRFHLGELVYGPIYRGKCELTPAMLRNIELKLISLDTTLIHCTDDESKIRVRFLVEKENFARSSKIKRALDLYQRAIELTFLPVITHTMKSSMDITTNGVLDSLIEKSKKIMPKYPSIIGNVINPLLVFVGDKQKSEGKYFKQFAGVKQPFDFGTSSNYLFNTLGNAGIPLMNVAFMSDEEIINKFCYHKSLLALGQKPATILKKLGFPFVQLNHPAYDSRFCKDGDYSLVIRKLYEKSEYYDRCTKF